MSLKVCLVDKLLIEWHQSLAYYALYLLAPFPCATDEEDKAAWAIVSRETSLGTSDENGLTTEEVKGPI